MSYTYSTLMDEISVLTAIPVANADFLSHFPTAINDAEQRIYRELELLTANVTVTGLTTANSRVFTLPTSSSGGDIHFLVIDAINIVNASGVRHPVTPTTREVIDFFYPNDTSFTTPSYPKEFCRSDETAIMYGPPPDSAYVIECIGTIRPAPLSASNPTTYLSVHLSDVLLAGVMVSMCGYMRNFGAMADDPRMAVSWRDEFTNRLASARQEELAKSWVSVMSSPPTSAKDA